MDSTRGTEVHHPYRRRLVINTLAAGASNGGTVLVALVTLPLLIRGLGPETFGLWALLQTFSATSGWLSLTDLGITTSTVSLVAAADGVGDGGRVRRLAGSALVMFSALSVIGALVFLLVGWFTFPALLSLDEPVASDFRLAIGWVAGQCLFDQLGRASTSCLDGLQRGDIARLLDLGRRLFALGGSAVVAVLSGSLAQTAAAATCGAALSTGLGLLVLHRSLPLASLTAGAQTCRELLRHGRSIAVLRPLGVIQRTMDRTIVAVLLGPAAVGVVEIATQVQNGAIAVMTASSSTVVPGASRIIARGDTATLRNLVSFGSRMTALATAAVSIPVIVLIHPILEIWVGTQANDALVPALLAITYTLLGSPLQVTSDVLVAMGRSNAVLRAAGCALIVNLAASVLLVSVMGVNGTFIATWIGGGIVWPMLLRSLTNELGTRARFLWDDVGRRLVIPALASAVAALGVAAAPFEDILTVTLGLVVALGVFSVAASLTSLDGRERSFLRGALGFEPTSDARTT